MCLNFDCGAQIKLGFAAEFSNVLVIYTYIIRKPEEMSFCQAHVTDFSQVSVPIVVISFRIKSSLSLSLILFFCCRTWMWILKR